MLFVDPARMPPPHRTIVYVDGFNFYYGQVRGTPYKWLDPAKLFGNLLGAQNNIVAVKYFTARVIPTARDSSIHVRQDTYLQAIAAYCPLVQVHFGHFLRHDVWVENFSPPPNTVRVWKTEEKGSDVNIAVHLLNDAWLNAYDCAVVVSNDSDLAEAMRLVRSQTQKILGLVTPGAPQRQPSWQLRQHVHFVKRITSLMLQNSLLPNPIPGTTLHKPNTW